MYNEPPSSINDVDAPASVFDRPQYLQFQENLNIYKISLAVVVATMAAKRLQNAL